MSKLKRTSDLLIGIVTILIGGALMVSAKQSDLALVAVVLGVTLMVRGIRSLHYYITMARHMVGGRRSLYMGIIYLEAGMLVFALYRNPGVILVIYLAIFHMFMGVVDALKGNEERGVGAPRWKMTMARGITDILIGLIMFVTGVVLGRMDIVVIVYGACLVYAGVLRIISAFRKTAIVYIQ